MGRLSVAFVRSAGPGRHADGDGLYLLVKPSGARSWMLRVQVDGKRRDIGLGAVDLRRSSTPNEIEIPLLLRRRLSLQEAREKCYLLRNAAVAGLDPVLERDKERVKIPTFREAVEECHKALSPSWSARQGASFLASLKQHAYPHMGRKRVDQIDAADIISALAPIWTTLGDMPRKVRGRISTVLNFSHSKGWRPTEAPGRSVSAGLPKRKAGGNYAAMPYDDVPAFVSSLAAKADTMGRLALLFTILTAARSGEVRQALWSHIDLEKLLWHRPAHLMKGRVAHSVTLCVAAATVLKRARAQKIRDGEDVLIFPGASHSALSDMTLSKVMRDEKLPFTVHGFRSSFRDWAAEKVPEMPDAVAEAALAHLVPDKVERAYKRSNFLEMRRDLLDRWGRFAAGSISDKPAQLYRPRTSKPE
ncbi:tyrosine-type recombinase/integrase [Sphingomonas crocodyli]|uniref:Site-specific integrase n=1 Tax=Sphingomonas crocodyli TaxID=1979270 RepID=A0A437M6C0_9SPHN|nr:site-specific integrase [Sphingomonas crocodyli]RVT93133.1 site-specific integrase [Sphingomonas crocodyli]